jgi:hypothetical protein
MDRKESSVKVQQQGMRAVGNEDERHNSSRQRLPIRDCDELTVDGVRGWLDGLNPEELQATSSYEIAHKNRKTLLGELDRRLNELDGSST